MVNGDIARQMSLRGTMAITLNEIRRIRRKIKPLLGQTVWGIKLLGNKGNYIITLNFGDEIVPAEEDEESYGDWRLWIWRCAWRLDHNDKILAGSMDDQQKIQTQLTLLENLPVYSFQVSRPALDTTINFDNRFDLRLFPVEMDKYFHWKLWFPNYDSLIIGPGSSWLYKKDED